MQACLSEAQAIMRIILKGHRNAQAQEALVRLHSPQYSHQRKIQRGRQASEDLCRGFSNQENARQ